MSQQDLQQRQLIRWIRAESARLLGRRYDIELERLDVASLRNLQRLLRDVGHELQVVARNARLHPWR